MIADFQVGKAQVKAHLENGRVKRIISCRVTINKEPVELGTLAEKSEFIMKKISEMASKLRKES